MEERHYRRYASSPRKRAETEDVKEDETILDVFVRQFLIAMLIFLTLFSLKALDNKQSKYALNYVKKNINYNMNVKKEKLYINKTVSKYLGMFKK